jgi:hypothetical protein
MELQDKRSQDKLIAIVQRLWDFRRDEFAVELRAIRALQILNCELAS